MDRVLHVARRTHDMGPALDLGPVERHLEEEPETGDDRVDLRGRGPFFVQPELEGTDLVGCCGIRRTTDEGGQALNAADVIALRCLGEAADRHVLDHAATQIADGLLTHRGLLSWDEVAPPP